VVITVGGQKKGTNIRNLLINVFLIKYFVFQAKFQATGMHMKSFTMSSFPQHDRIAEYENTKPILFPFSVDDGIRCASKVLKMQCNY
jgi:hypothetical protein